VKGRGVEDAAPAAVAAPDAAAAATGRRGGAADASPEAAAAAGVKRPRDAEEAEDPRDAELRELRAKLRAAEAAARQAAASDAAKAVEQATCAICADVWEAPVTAPGCGHVCCKACLMDCASLKNECPQCCMPLVATEQRHAATAEFPTFASKAAFELPVSVVLRELADEARAKEGRGSAAECSAIAAARLLRLVPCHAPGAPVNARIPQLALAIAAPADARLADSRGRSLLWWASHKQLGALAAWLVDGGADVNAADAHFKRTPLMGRMALSGSQAAIKTLLAKGADMHAKGADGKSALDLLEPRLHAANNADQLEYLLLLAEVDVFKGADPPSKLLPFFGPAVSKRAHRDVKK
jgi:hypothetical protein